MLVTNYDTNNVRPSKWTSMTRIFCGWPITVKLIVDEVVGAYIAWSGRERLQRTQAGWCYVLKLINVKQREPTLNAASDLKTNLKWAWLDQYNSEYLL